MASINRTVKTCVWVLGGPGAAACGRSTKWTWAYDDDGSRVRNYDTLCPTHRVKADKRATEQDDLDGMDL